MSLYRLGRTLVVGGVVDALTPPVRHVGLLRSGQFFAIVGVVCAGGRIVIHGERGNLLVVAAAFSFVLAAFLLFSFALAAKLYAQVAVASVLLFFGACFGIVVMESGPSQPLPELATRSRSPLPDRTLTARVQQADLSQEQEENAGLSAAEKGVLTSEQAKPKAKEAPVTPTTPLVALVYAVNKTHLYYPQDCAPRPKNAFRIPRSIALQQGYTLAPECTAR